jgi:hypothetical protein
MNRGSYPISPHLVEVAKSTKQVNLAKDARAIEPRINRQLVPLLT